MQQSCTVDQKTLVTLLSSMLPICSKRTTIEATASICLQIGNRELIMKSTDLEIALQVSCQLEESTFTEPVTILVPGRRLYDVVKEFEGSIVCSLQGPSLLLCAGSAQVKLHTASPEGFPPFPERIENLMHIDTDILSEMLKGVAGIIPQQHVNSVLAGLSWEIGPKGIVLTATDGHCLAQTKSAQYTLAEYSQWIIPRRAVIELQKIIELTKERILFIGVCGKQVVFSGELFNFFTKLLAGTFPQYAPVLQRDSFMPARIDRQQLAKALRRTTTLLSGQFLATQFQFEGSIVRLSMQNKEVGALEEAVTLYEYIGEPCNIRFYAPYILQGLGAFPEEQICLFLKSSTRPIMFEASKPSGIEIVYLVMPVAATAAASPTG